MAVVRHWTALLFVASCAAEPVYDIAIVGSGPGAAGFLGGLALLHANFSALRIAVVEQGPFVTQLNTKLRNQLLSAATQCERIPSNRYEFLKPEAVGGGESVAAGILVLPDRAMVERAGCDDATRCPLQGDVWNAYARLYDAYVPRQEARTQLEYVALKALQAFDPLVRARGVNAGPVANATGAQPDHVYGRSYSAYDAATYTREPLIVQLWQRHPNVDLVHSTEVTRIDRWTSGVGATLQLRPGGPLRARSVVLAAGMFGSPRLLRRSGMLASDELPFFQRGRVVLPYRLPQVGTETSANGLGNVYLNSDANVFVMFQAAWTFPQSYGVPLMPALASTTRLTQRLKIGVELAVHAVTTAISGLFSEVDRPLDYVAVHVAQQQTPELYGRLSVRSDGTLYAESRLPTTSAGLLATAREFLRTSDPVLRAHGAQPLFAADVLDGDDAGDLVQDFWHMGGTLSAVVDERLQVPGHEGVVYVSDFSVAAENNRANPVALIHALGVTAAARWLEDRR